MDLWNILSFMALGFTLGSIPFAYILARVFTGRDVRAIGDGNPGAANAWKAGGWRIGLLAVFFDLCKGFLPLYLAQRAGLSEWALVPVALSPILGHALQPFLQFRGGKALAVSGGVWLAWIGPRVFPVYASLTLPVLALQEEHAWAAFSGTLALLAYALWLGTSPALMVFAALNMVLIGWTHRRELAHAPRPRAWVGHLLSRREA